VGCSGPSFSGYSLPFGAFFFFFLSLSVAHSLLFSPFFCPESQSRHNRSFLSRLAVPLPISVHALVNTRPRGVAVLIQAREREKRQSKGKLRHFTEPLLLFLHWLVGEAIHPGLASIRQTPKSLRTSRHLPLANDSQQTSVDSQFGIRLLGQTLFSPVSGPLRIRVSRHS
jgi:hypothetical protein